MREKIEDELVAIGVYPNLKGFNYIRIIVEEIIDSNLKAKNIMSLYESVSKKEKVSIKSVERAIRTAVSKCDKFAVCGCDCGLTNSEFLYTLALNVKRGGTKE